MSDALYFFLLGLIVGGVATVVGGVLLIQASQDRISKRMRR